MCSRLTNYFVAMVKWLESHNLPPGKDFLLPLLSPWETGSWSEKNIFPPPSQQKPTDQPTPLSLQVLSTFNDVVWHASWSITGDILAISGGDNKVGVAACVLGNCCHENRSVVIILVRIPH